MGMGVRFFTASLNMSCASVQAFLNSSLLPRSRFRPSRSLTSMAASPFKTRLHHTETLKPPGSGALRTESLKTRRPSRSFSSQSGSSSGSTLNSQSPENRTTLARLIFKVLSVTSTSTSLALASSGTKRFSSTVSLVCDQAYLSGTKPPFISSALGSCARAGVGVASTLSAWARAARSVSSSPGQPPRRMAFSNKRMPSETSPFLKALSPSARHCNTSSRRSSPSTRPSSSVSNGSSSSSSISTSAAA
mmetsp:Transcript_29742/g.64191  ORF Transcript_29742/g.64191 Transcript_29742/m.64191 type:complete len:248 (+) Transcript_29742:58-801(+)